MLRNYSACQHFAYLLINVSCSQSRGCMNDRPWPLEPRRYYPLLNTTIMTQDYETDLLSAVATEVCDELFSVAERDPKIMVNNWCAFAVLAIFREVSLILGGAAIPTLDECMDGGHTPQCLLRSAKWGQLMSWHEEHWQKSQFPELWPLYEPYIFTQSLIIGRHVLSP